MPSSRSIHVLAVATTLVAGLAGPLHAQLNTQHVKGSFGVKGGSQPPPGEYAIAPLLYFYSTDEIRNKNGDQVPINANIDAALFGAGVAVVTEKTILGGYYGFNVLIAGANNRLQGTEIDRTLVPGSPIRSSVPSSSGGTRSGATPSCTTNSIYQPVATRTAQATTLAWACGDRKLAAAAPST